MPYVAIYRKIIILSDLLAAHNAFSSLQFRIRHILRTQKLFQSVKSNH